MRKFLALVTCLAFHVQGLAAEIVIPANTKFYGELTQHISTHKKRGNRAGEIVRAKVWRDVYVDGVKIIKAGTPMTFRITKSQHNRTFGRKGSLALEADSVQLVDGQIVELTGGYNKEGKNKIAAAAAVIAVVSIFGLFIKGKNAEMQPGTLISAETYWENRVQVPDSVLPPADAQPIKAREKTDNVNVQIDYLELASREKPKSIPVNLENCEGQISDMRVSNVNDRTIDPIEVDVGEITVDESGCAKAKGEIPLKPLAKEFRLGINRFKTVVVVKEAYPPAREPGTPNMLAANVEKEQDVIFEIDF